ncbi:MAG: hypothetical protein V4481_01140 [Patescibacteria group bacterium]
MKQFILSVIIAVVSLCTCVQAQTDTNINPLNVARGLALKPATSYQWYVSGEMLVSNQWRSYYFQYTVRKSDGAITDLSVNGVAIKLAKPAIGLPLGDGGMMRGVYANASAFTKSGEYAGFGYTQKDLVRKGETISVTLAPAEIAQEIQLDPIYMGQDLNLRIENFPYGYGWGWQNGKFTVYTTPIGGKFNYTITLRDGTTISSGVLEPYKPVVVDNNTYSAINYVGNVIEGGFKSPAGQEEWTSTGSVEFDCLIPLPGQPAVYGKVIFMDVDVGGLDLTISGNYGVLVQKVTEQGDMPFLPLQNLSSSGNGYVETRVATGQNVGKIVVSVIPHEKSGQAWISLHRFYGPLDTSGGGKGGPSAVAVTEP